MILIYTIKIIIIKMKYLINIDQFILEKAKSKNIFVYHINLDERGIFDADVRKNDKDVVFNIHIDLSENDDNFFEEGWMKNSTDLSGLEEYLRMLEIMKDDDELVSSDIYNNR